MSKQPQLTQIPTSDLQNLFIQTAQAAYQLKPLVQQGNQVAQFQYTQQQAVANAVWNVIEGRSDFNVNFGTANDGQGMAHWSLELSDNDLTKKIHTKGKQFQGNHALSFNYLDTWGKSTCFWSAEYKNKEMVEYCVRNGALINVIDKVGNSLTQIISKAGWADIIALANRDAVTDPVWKILLDTVEAQGNSIVFYKETKEKDAAQAIQSLKNADTTTEMPDCAISSLISSKGMLPYYFACQVKSGLIAHKLLNAPTINTDHKDSNGWGHFHWVINLPEVPNAKGKMMQMEMLSKKGCNVNAVDNGGKTPLHHTEYLSPETATKLLELGADVNIQDTQGYTPITLACAKFYQYKKTNIEVSKQVAGMACHILKVALDTKKHIDFSVRDNGQKAPIGHWLLEVYCNDASHNDIFNGLKAKCYDINMVDGNNKTLMDWSVQYKWKEAVKVLHDDCGAEVTLKHMQMVSNDADFISFLQPLCVDSIASGLANVTLSGDNAGDDIADLYS